MKRLLYMIIALLTCSFFLTIVVKAMTINEPVFELIGDEYIYLQKGTKYYEYGAKATDIEGNDLTSSIEIDSSSLNINQIGLYKIKYTVRNSDLNEVIKERFVQVYEQIYEEKNLSFNDANIVEIFSLVEDYFIVFSQENNLGFITTIDKWGNELEKTNFLLSENESDDIYINKIIETKDNHYFIIGRNETENNSFFIKLNLDGEIISQSTLESSEILFAIIEYQNNEFVLTDGVNLYYFTGTSYQETINLSITIDNISSLPNGDIVIYQNDNEMVKIFINDTELETISGINLIDIFTHEENIILIGNTIGTNLGCIYILNQEGEFLSNTYTESFQYANQVNDNLLIYTENDAVLLIESKSLNVYSSHHFSTNNIIKTISTNSNEQIYIGTDEEVILLSPNIIFTEFDNLTVFANQSFDVDTNINITNFAGEVLEYQINSVDEVLDTSIVGYHELIYNLTVESKTLRLTRKVTVLPNDVEDGGIYHTPVIINNGDIPALLNGEAYNNDEINEAGYYELTICDQTINFTIIPDYNIEADGIYKQGIILVNPSVSATYLVDGKIYIPGETYLDIGHHTLTVISEKGYSHTIEFTITEDVDFDDYHEFTYKAVFEITHAELRVDGKSYLSGKEILDVGIHELKIIGANGYENTYTFTIRERVSYLEDGGIYKGSITPLIPNATLKLDGKAYLSGTKITDIGHHILTVIGTNGYINEYHFTIDFETLGLEDGGEYIDFVTPIIIGGTVTLNGEAYLSGTKITEIGHHTIVITGENDYQKEIRFTIKSGFTEKTYTSSVIPNINAEKVTLNGVLYNNEEINSVGNYELEIMGRGGFRQIIKFTIIPVFGIENGSSYLEEVIPVISGGNAIYEIDGNPYTPGEKIVIVGNHTLTVIGNLGYEVYIDFTIIEKSNIQNDSIHHKEIIIDIPNAELILNGEVINNKTEINLVGNHSLKIIGTNGYEKIINFVITPEINIIDNSEYESELIVEVKNVQKILLNNVVYQGEKIFYAGNYEVIIYGVNDYSIKYQFSIKEKLIDIEPNGIYQGEVYPKIVNGEILINGKVHKSGAKFTEIGIHELKIIGLNNYEKTYYFTVEPIIEGVIDGKTYEGSVSINIPNAQVKLNKEIIANKSTIYDVGNHIITIYGNGGYEKTINFIITPIIEGIEANKTYFNSIKVNIPNAKLLIDGKEYVSGTEYKKIGKHVLTIIGTNDYQQEINFTIKYSTNVLIQQIVIITVPVIIIGIMIFIGFRLRRKVI